MASESAHPSEAESSFFETLINSRNRDNLSPFFPFIVGLNSTSPLQDSENQASLRDRIILINPFTQGMVIIERTNNSDTDSSPLGFDSFLSDMFSSKSGQPPASKASIDAMESVEISEIDGDQCVICLEEWESGEKVKQMPCKHRFHGECIEKWLKIHGSCPVCRYEMPVEESDGDKNRGSEEGGDGERRRGVWVSFTFSRGRRTGDSDRDLSSESSEDRDSLASDREMQQG